MIASLRTSQRTLLRILDVNQARPCPSRPPSGPHAADRDADQQLRTTGGATALADGLSDATRPSPTWKKRTWPGNERKGSVSGSRKRKTKHDGGLEPLRQVMVFRLIPLKHSAVEVGLAIDQGERSDDAAAQLRQRPQVRRQQPPALRPRVRHPGRMEQDPTAPIRRPTPHLDRLHSAQQQGCPRLFHRQRLCTHVRPRGCRPTGEFSARSYHRIVRTKVPSGTDAASAEMFSVRNKFATE